MATVERTTDPVVLEPPPVVVPLSAAARVAAEADASGADTASVASTNPFEDHPETDDSHDPDPPLRLPRRGLCGLCRESEEERYERVLTATALTRMQKNSVRRRYFELLRDFRVRCRMYSFLFHIGHFTITVGSLVVPALLSVQYASAGITFIDATSFQAQVYWTTWILSLLVTMFNGILVLFKVDMKYYFLHTTLERLRSEGWQYLELTGRYAGALTQNGETPSHRNQFKYFCHYIEKIKLKQVEEEYYKYEDSQKNAGGASTTGASATGATAAGTATTSGPPGGAVGTVSTSTAAPAAASASAPSTGPHEQKRDLPLYPPSIDKNLATLAEQAPPSVQEAIRGIVKSQKSLASMQHLLPQTLQQPPQNTVIVPPAESFPPNRVADAQTSLPVLAAVRRTSA
jgi:hypothetical protein